MTSVAKMDEFCKENMFSAWYETSAKENVHIDDAAKTLVSQVRLIFDFFFFLHFSHTGGALKMNNFE